MLSSARGVTGRNSRALTRTRRRTADQNKEQRSFDSYTCKGSDFILSSGRHHTQQIIACFIQNLSYRTFKTCNHFDMCTALLSPFTREMLMVASVFQPQNARWTALCHNLPSLAQVSGEETAVSPECSLLSLNFGFLSTWDCRVTDAIVCHLITLKDSI